MWMGWNALSACFCSVAFIFNYRMEDCSWTRLALCSQSCGWGREQRGWQTERHLTTMQQLWNRQPLAKAKLCRWRYFVTGKILEVTKPFLRHRRWLQLYHPYLTAVLLLLTRNLHQLNYTNVSARRSAKNLGKSFGETGVIIYYPSL